MAMSEKLKRYIPIIVGVLVGILFILSIYLVGYRRGYAVCTKNKKPEVTAQKGSIVNVFNSDPRDKPIFIGVKVHKVGVGLSFDRK